MSLPSHREGQSQSPFRGHTTLQRRLPEENKSPELWKIKYDLDRHYQREDICAANRPPRPQGPVQGQGRGALLWDPAQAGMAWICSMGSPLVPGNELAGPKYVQLEGKKSVFSLFNWRWDIRHSILFKEIVCSFTAQSKQEENENWRDKSRQISLLKLWGVITGITES